MPLDGICMQAVAEELRSELLGLRIDKVQQPARDQVILLLRGNKRLLLNRRGQHSPHPADGPDKGQPGGAPMFCMLLRKHLVGDGGCGHPAAPGAAGTAGAGRY